MKMNTNQIISIYLLLSFFLYVPLYGEKLPSNNFSNINIKKLEAHRSLSNKPADIPEYFNSKIYNTSLINDYKNKCTFSILSYEKGFDLAGAINFGIEKKIKYIFIIFAGQQGGVDSKGNSLQGDSSRTDPAADEFYCRKLTGGNRIPENGKWEGQYSIHTSKTYPSTASKLFDIYNQEALIITVLNTKYNWLKSKSEKKKILADMSKTIDNIYKKIITGLSLQGISNHEISFFICGFSRGGVFALRFADKLAEMNYKISAVATIDPVINPLSEEINMVQAYGIKEKEGWIIQKKINVFIRPNFPEYFSVLFKQHPKVKVYYNVFQRRAVYQNLFSETSATPIGSAVYGAQSPMDTNWAKENNILFSPVGTNAPFNQYDTGMTKHAPDMLEKYADWIVYIAESIFPCNSN